VPLFIRLVLVQVGAK